MAERNLGIIEELAKSLLSKAEKEKIIIDYFPIRMAFEDFLRKGEHTKREKMMGFTMTFPSWKRRSEVKTPLGTIELTVDTLERGSAWEVYSEDIPNSRITVFLSKENDTPEGTENRYQRLHLFSMQAVRVPFEQHVDLEEVQGVTRKLSPLVELMKAQGLV